LQGVVKFVQFSGGGVHFFGNGGEVHFHSERIAGFGEEARKKLFSIQDFFFVFKLAQEVVEVALF
jgi:hypothetical protein